MLLITTIIIAVDVDQHYGRQLDTNQPPQPVYRQQPHGMSSLSLYIIFITILTI